MKNWFAQGGQAYARYRPDYPAELAQYLARIAPSRRMALDVGCGNGQLTRLLAPHFDEVLGLDPSADQIAHADAQAGVHYQQASAEQLPVADGRACLITAAQAAHWFDRPRFYQEARRVAAPNAVLALITYGVMVLANAAGERFQAFHEHEIGPYWPPERRLVDSGYADIDFPFDEIKPPAMQITQHWNLDQLLGYVSTWSAVRQAREKGRSDMLITFAQDLKTLWGDAAQVRTITWPIHMRVGILSLQFDASAQTRKEP